MTLLSRNIAAKYEFVTEKDGLPEKAFLEKAATNKNLNIHKHYQELDKVSESDKKWRDETINKDDKKTTIKRYNKSNLIYDNNHGFYKYHDIKKFDNVSLKGPYIYDVHKEGV